MDRHVLWRSEHGCSPTCHGRHLTFNSVINLSSANAVSTAASAGAVLTNLRRIRPCNSKTYAAGEWNASVACGGSRVVVEKRIDVGVVERVKAASAVRGRKRNIEMKKRSGKEGGGE
jgi:hypothetical protein